MADGVRLSRRAFLRRAGLGASAVVLAGLGAGIWRAIDQGVFATGQGPAYQAWKDWRGVPGEGFVSFVRAAILAANAHNSQPWIFAIHPDRIDVFADRTRNLGAMDPLRREMYMSLGCALENLTLAARAAGYAASVDFLPDPADPTYAARVHLASDAASVSPLYEAIPHRHTDRAPYDPRRQVQRSVLDALARLADSPNASVLWITADNDKRRFGDLTVEATEAIIADQEQSTDSFRWFRLDWDELQRHKDGITLDTAGLPDVIRALAKILPAQSRSSTDKAWLDATRKHHVATAAAFGLVVLRDRHDNAQRLETGRLYQRIHLHATTQGLSMQPLAQVTERVDRETASGRTGGFTNALAAFTPGWQTVLPFRIGYPTGTPHLSPRRPAAEVIRR